MPKEIQIEAKEVNIVVRISGAKGEIEDTIDINVPKNLKGEKRRTFILEAIGEHVIDNITWDEK